MCTHSNTSTIETWNMFVPLIVGWMKRKNENYRKKRRQICPFFNCWSFIVAFVNELSNSVPQSITYSGMSHDTSVRKVRFGNSLYCLLNTRNFATVNPGVRDFRYVHSFHSKKIFFVCVCLIYEVETRNCVSCQLPL